MTYISRKNIPENTIEAREYQTTIADKALTGNTLVILPTGMGKTAVALLVAAERIEVGKILMLAPTKPLVEQHLRYFSKNLLLEKEDIVMFTGSTPSDKRVKIWKSARFIVSTPEVIRNDLDAGRYGLTSVSLLVVDECHRAVGNYAYVPIAENYNSSATRPLVLGMTASPGYDKEHVAEICQHLSITSVEIRTEDDEDVKPYVHEREMDSVYLELPEELWLSVSVLNGMIDDRLSKLENLHYHVPKREMLSMKALNGLMAQIQSRMQQKDMTAYHAISVHAELMKLKHGSMLAESQGSTALKAYLQKLESESVDAKGSKASKRICADPRFRKLLELSENWTTELHPKAEAVVRIVQEQLLLAPDSKIIVFVTYRDSVQMLVNFLNEAGISARRFVGQATRETEKGLSQKKQIEAIQQFREGEYSVLVATSVGEEGLDIPSTDLVIFYEPVPSDVRSIQRKGRTGRNNTGRVVVLVTKGTADETFRWVSSTKEKKMIKSVTKMKTTGVPVRQISVPAAGETKYAPSGQQTLADMVIGTAVQEDEDAPVIHAAVSEKGSKVAASLEEKGANISWDAFSAGKYRVGKHILFNYLKLDEFADMLVDEDIFAQMKILKELVRSPVLLIEGGALSNLYNKRSLPENAIRNTFARITMEYGVPVFFTKDPEESAGLIFSFARRSQDETTEYPPEKENADSLAVLTAVPAINPKVAETLLREFGSLKAVFTASKDDLLNVDGITEDVAASLIKVAIHPWRK